MEAQRVNQYWHALNILEAREGLQQLEIFSYPHLKPEGQRKLEAKLKKAAYPAQGYISVEELQERLKNLAGG